MHIEIKHLRTIKAVKDTGGLGRAAEVLNMTQSALSHQIKAIEDQAGVELFVRRSKPLRLSAAGLEILKAAEKILPVIEDLQADFQGLRSGHQGRLHIALECRACYDWLLPVLDNFRKIWPQVDIDLRGGVAFDSMTALMREDIDLIISSDHFDDPDVAFTPLFDYDSVFICAADHPLAQHDMIKASDFKGLTLLTYPVPFDRLDVFKTVLDPANVNPGAIRQVELTPMILMLVAAGKGVAVLPDWVVQNLDPVEFSVHKLGPGTVTRRMYALTRAGENTLPYMAYFTRIAREQAVRLMAKIGNKH